MKVVLLIFLLILTFLIVRKTKNNESFGLIPEVTIDFLNKKQACKVLDSSNKYFEYLNKNDLEARSIITYNASNIPRPSTSNIINYYCDHVLEFTDKEKMKIKMILNWLLRNCPNKFCKYFKKWRIAKFDNTIENGYPHTHKDVVFVSQKFVDEILSSGKTNHVIDTFIHEQVHVLQRKMPDKFEKLYTNYWHFKKVNEIQGIENLLDLYRTNPDGLDVNYVFKNKIWIGCVYKKVPQKRMDIVYYHAVPVKKSNPDVFILDESKDIENLSSNKDFSDFFDGIYSNNYHPNELSAESLAKHITYEMNIYNNSNYNTTSPYLNKMKVWLKKEL